MVSLGHLQCVLVLLRPRGAHEDDPLGPPGSLGILQFEDAADLFDFCLVVLAGFKFCDLTLASLFDASNLEVVLGSSGLGELLEAHGIILALEEVGDFVAAIFDFEPIKGLLLRLVQHDEFVGDDAHLLEGNCLYLCHREALDNPALLILFHRLDLRSHQCDDDFVGDILLAAEGLFDLLTELTPLADFPLDEVPDHDALELAALIVHSVKEGESDHVALAAWWANNHDSSGYNNQFRNAHSRGDQLSNPTLAKASRSPTFWALELLDEMLDRVFWPIDDQ